MHDDHTSFSPLFIGAMVATRIPSDGGKLRFAFSPLFIGAMVATDVARFGEDRTVYTFSPLFIGAMVATAFTPSRRCTFAPFSPLFIGAMVATCYPEGMAELQDRWNFQSPFHRGNGCYRPPNQ